MKRFFILLIVIIIVGCNAPLRDCTDFKNGTYRISDKERGFESIIIRNDSIQIEKNNTQNTETKYLITWSTDCEYSLKIIEGPKAVMKFYKDKPLHIRVTSTTEGKYTFEATTEGVDQIRTNTAYKID